ncbi:glycoside hydrolase family 95 protein [Lacibacter sp.]|uniref:glycoside hydrolase family 95 protein n=1 Tax=Lacibacter sp. TaxID=1915409 RepID=UPI002B4AF207|nr:glycoside hydrolase family 95 protein [Lacibacter sp.]HLP36321.1 glycoside hydrolase family 95 protein [Lacibacter sp.]
MMLKFNLLIVIFLMQLPLLAQQSTQTKPAGKAAMCWWYNKPAEKYWEGVPIATGRFAAMIGGKTVHEDIVFNDETLWSGSPYNPNNPEGPKILETTRKYVREKDYVKATAEALKLNSTPMSVQHYQPMGILNIAFGGYNETDVKQYTRRLSMDSAIAAVEYTAKGITYRREIFASYPDQVIAIKLTANKKGSINITAALSSLQASAFTTIENGDIIMQGGTTELSTGRYVGTVIPSIMKWQARLKVIIKSGTASLQKNGGTTGHSIVVTNADNVTLLLSGATNWQNWSSVNADEKKRCNNYLLKASRYSYAQLRSRHLADYVPLFAACTLELGANEMNSFSTTDRIEKLRGGTSDNLFVAQYFQYGRYLMLAGSREGTLAFNNHNIWLNNMEGRWQGRWTLNINIQECFWPVESTNMSKLNESLVYFTEQLAAAGKRTAKELYGCRGWVAHHGTDIWFNTAPTDKNPKATVWPLGGAWILQQLFDHYQYNPGNKVYLNKIYPLLKGSVDFFLDFLVTDSLTGYLVTCPSTTPENNFYTDNGEIATTTMATSMDNQILRNLFRNYVKAAAVLNKDADVKKKVEKALQKLPPHQIGKYGQLQEWLYDFKEVEQGHRHISHLFAAFPDDDITLRKTPELAQAVRVVLQRRGNINKGWSGAWKINQHARLEEPEPAYNILTSMLTEISLHPREEDSKITPSFEGNQGIQGITAGITEMLMQSHSNEIYLLPALPKAWPTGSIKGLRARGGYGIDIFWSDGKLTAATLKVSLPGKCNLRSKTPLKIMLKGKEIKAEKLDNDTYTFNVTSGNIYQLAAL